jgi:hypothetical protein
MTAHQQNLLRAAKLLTHIADIGGPNEFEGALISDIVTDIRLAAQRAQVQEAVDELYSVKVPENVVEFSDYLRASGRLA